MHRPTRELFGRARGKGCGKLQDEVGPVLDGMAGARVLVKQRHVSALGEAPAHQA